MENLHFLDGKWLATSKLKISAFDLSIMRGFGIFDYLRTYKRRPFFLGEHLDRLYNSAKILGIRIPQAKKELEKLIDLGIEKNRKEAELNIRIIVTGGVGPDSVTPGNPSLMIMFTPWVGFPKEYYEKGIKVMTVRTKRVIPEAKTLNYLQAVISLQKAKKQNAVEVIYVDEDGAIYEGTTSNFFAVMDNTLVTPKEEILYGITRRLLIGIARKLKIKVIERKLNICEIGKFQEAFVTASNKEVMPVVRIDKTRIGDGKVGKITRRLMKEYDDLKEKI